jgi:hypothetical protein
MSDHQPDKGVPEPDLNHLGVYNVWPSEADPRNGTGGAYVALRDGEMGLRSEVDKLLAAVGVGVGASDRAKVLVLKGLIAEENAMVRAKK